MKYAIYPPIGLARIGNSPTEFFIGPERRGSRGTQIDGAGTETEVTAFKDAAFRVKPQAARFTVFEIPTAARRVRRSSRPARPQVDGADGQQEGRHRPAPAVRRRRR